MTSVFLQACGILVREGLEALLVVAALAAYLTKAGGASRLSALWAGAALAVLASIVAAWAFEVFYGGVHNDILEGVTILAAAALMLYVSGWLLLRQDPKAWQSYLKEKADRALEQRTVIAVALLAFLAVFREGAETVLFIHALAQTSGGWTAGLFGGLGVAAFVLAALFVVIQTLAVRLPLRAVFIVTSGFLFVMAVKFIGEGIQEFQEQVLVPYHEVDVPSWLSAVGINPSVEALTAQAAVIALAVCTYVVLHRRTRRGPEVLT
jgi:high-affinity iron transporter